MAEGLGETAAADTQRPLWVDIAVVSAVFLLAAIPAFAAGSIQRLDWAISLIFGAVLALLSIIDLRRFILPDLITLPLVLAGLGLTWLLQWDELLLRTLAAVAGFLILYLVAVGYRRLRGRDGLGLGDAKLLAASGAWLGLSALPQVLLAASLLALLTVAGLIVAGRKMTMRTAIPFGPFLAFATWLIWLYGNF